MNAALWQPIAAPGVEPGTCGKEPQMMPFHYAAVMKRPSSQEAAESYDSVTSLTSERFSALFSLNGAENWSLFPFLLSAGAFMWAFRVSV